MPLAESKIAFTLDKKQYEKFTSSTLGHSDDEAGKFRGDGKLGTSYSFKFRGGYCPTPNDDGGEELRQEFEAAQKFLNAIRDPTETALAYYCMGVRNQFLPDGNKRAALVTANGLLVQGRRPAIIVHPSQLTSLNKVIDEFHYFGDATAVMSALCAHIETSLILAGESPSRHASDSSSTSANRAGKKCSTLGTCGDLARRSGDTKPRQRSDWWGFVCLGHWPEQSDLHVPVTAWSSGLTRPKTQRPVQVLELSELEQQQRGNRFLQPHDLCLRAEVSALGAARRRR